MNVGVVSARYAKSLFLFAENHRQTKTVYEAMLVLITSFQEVSKLAGTLSDPVLTQEEKLRILQLASGNKQSTCLDRFFRLLLKKRRVDLMPFIAHSFVGLYKDKNNIVLCKLTVPAQVETSAIERIKSIVEDKTSKSVEFSVNIDSSIIGGFVLQYDSNYLDASVSGYLRNLRKCIS